MQRIRFTKRAVFEQFGPNHPDNPVFEVGDEPTLTNDQAERWLKREKAELVEDLGPDILETADTEQVQEITQAVRSQLDDEIDAMSDRIAAARSELQGL